MRNNRTILAKMMNEEFNHSNNIKFSFTRGGDIFDIISGQTYPNMNQFFIAKGYPNMRANKCVNKAGYSFNDVYDNYELLDQYGIDVNDDDEFDPERPINNNEYIMEVLKSAVYFYTQYMLDPENNYSFETCAENCIDAAHFLITHPNFSVYDNRDVSLEDDTLHMIFEAIWGNKKES